MYVVELTEDAKKDIFLLQRNAPSAVRKLARLLGELREHPRTGTGQVERLRHCKNETWSRRITQEHRLVYEIHDDLVVVLVISSYGHYDDK